MDIIGREKQNNTFEKSDSSDSESEEDSSQTEDEVMKEGEVEDTENETIKHRTGNEISLPQLRK